MKRIKRVNRKRGRKSSASISSKVKIHTKAVKTLGRKNIKRGPKLVAVSKSLKPDAKGLKVLSNEIKKMRSAPADATFTYKLVVRDTGKKKKIRKTSEGLVLPTKGEIARSEFVRIKDKKTGKYKNTKRRLSKRGQTMAQFEERIRKEVFANRPSLSKTQYRKFNALMKSSKRKARAFLKQILKKKGVTFKVEIYREI